MNDKKLSLDQFLDQVIMTFSEAQSGEYSAIDKEVGDALHQNFKK